MNEKTNNIFNSIIRLWPFIKKDKKYRIYIYAFLTIVSAFADLVSIGAIVPFIIVFTDPIQLNDIEFFLMVKNYFEINTIEEIQTFLFSCFSFAVIFLSLIHI